MDQFLDRNPTIEGMIELETALKLKERGYEYYGLNEPFRLGKVVFVHGLYTVAHHAKKHVIEYGQNVVYGHVHSHQKYTKSNLDNYHSAESVPCLCELKKPFLKNGPTAWSHGFAVLYLFKEGFHLDVVPINRGVCVFNGRIYGRKK